MKTLTFNQYKEKVLELYEEVYKILEEEDIPWWVHSGTLLGIKRHNEQIIPWDDDIDIMVPANIWKEKIKIIDNQLKNKKFKLIDWTFTDLKIRSDAWFAKVYYNEEYMVISDDGKKSSPYPQRPFIDIFYSVPADSYTNESQWRKYEFYVKLQWAIRPGFDRFLAAKDNKYKNFAMNLISYPAKIFFSRKKVKNYLLKPYSYDGDWTLLRRADPWASRKHIYDLKNMVEGKISGKKAIYSKEWENELIESYGKKWDEPIYSEPHIFKKYFGKWERANEIKRILDNTYNK